MLNTCIAHKVHYIKLLNISNKTLENYYIICFFFFVAVYSVICFYAEYKFPFEKINNLVTVCVRRSWVFLLIHFPTLYSMLFILLFTHSFSSSPQKYNNKYEYIKQNIPITTKTSIHHLVFIIATHMNEQRVYIPIMFTVQR